MHILFGDIYTTIVWLYIYIILFGYLHTHIVWQEVMPGSINDCDGSHWGKNISSKRQKAFGEKKKKISSKQTNRAGSKYILRILHPLQEQKAAGSSE